MKTNHLSVMERIIFSLFAFLLPGAIAHALPEASCQQTIQDFQKIKSELQQAKSKNICSVVLQSKISKYEKTNSCAEVYLVADRAIASYEAQRKTGCTNLQQLITNAKSCNPSSANQAQCFLAAAEAYEFASGLEKQIVGGVQQNINQLGLVETAGQKAIEKYQYDLDQSKSAIGFEKGRRGQLDNGNDSLVNAETNSATVVKNGRLGSGISGDVVAADGGKKTIVEYHEALKGERGYIGAHSEALRFANEFRLEAEKIKKNIQQKISSFDQAAKESRSRAQGSATASDDNKAPVSEAGGGSGISMPSLPMSAGAESSTSPENYSPMDRSANPEAKTKRSNDYLKSQNSKQTIMPKTDGKNVNRESISYQKSSKVEIRGAARKEKKSSRFEFNAAGKNEIPSQNFESKGSALLGVLREKRAESEKLANPADQTEFPAETAGGLEEKTAESQPDEAPTADEGEADVAEGGSSTIEPDRELASTENSEVQEDLGFDLSTSLFDRVNRKLYHAYRTGRVIYER